MLSVWRRSRRAWIIKFSRYQQETFWIIAFFIIFPECLCDRINKLYIYECFSCLCEPPLLLFLGLPAPILLYPVPICQKRCLRPLFPFSDCSRRHRPFPILILFLEAPPSLAIVKTEIQCSLLFGSFTCLSNYLYCSCWSLIAREMWWSSSFAYLFR